MTNIISIDCETHKIEPGLLAPPLACMSYSHEGETGLVDSHEAPAFLKDIAENTDAVVVGHNIPFDFAAMCAHDASLVDVVFKLYEDGRVKDTQVRETLSHIRAGTFAYNRSKFGLAAVTERYLGQTLDKSADTWRARYGELIDVPMSEWPPEAISYAENDAEATRQVYLKQEDSPDELLQVRAGFALHLMSVWGVRTEPGAVNELEEKLLQDHIELAKPLLECDLLTKTKDGYKRSVKLLRVLVGEILGDLAPRTNPSKKFPNGQIKTDDKTLVDIDDPRIKPYQEYMKNEKLLNTFVPVLRLGTEGPINARFNVLVGTGRTSCDHPNLQQQPRKGSVRGCYVPRVGWVYVTCDYDSAELRALAQVCFTWFGQSELRKTFIAGIDPHLDLAAQFLGIPYDEAARRKAEGDEEIKDARQFCKIGNFGFPGGLGPDKFVLYARGYDYKTTIEEAVKLRDAWFARWTEMRYYFNRISQITGPTGPGSITQLRSERKRGNTGFCQAANGYFQSLIADAAKCALWEVAKACYVDRDSAMFGCRPVMFVHDEIIMEAPEDRAPEAAIELAKVMISAAQPWLPDVPVKASSALMRRWYKGAESVTDSSGRPVPWEPI